MIVYGYEGELYPEEVVDIDPATGKPEVEEYVRYEIPDNIVLSAEQVCGGYGQIIEILSRAGVLK